MSIRAKDLAQILGVSTSTISIVLNNRPGVSNATRAMVLDKIQELHCDYLLRDPTESDIEKATIGFVVYKRFGDIIDEAPFFNYSLESITDTLKEENYDLKFIYINKSSSPEQQIKLLTASNCLGLIIYGVEMYEDDLEVFIQTKLPFVLLDNSFQTRDVDCVAINNIQGIHKAMQYLFSMGHRRIGYLKSRITITSFQERFREYRHQLSLLGLPYEERHTIEMGYSEQAVRNAIEQYLSGQEAPLPTAFLADNDLLGCYAMQAFKKHGYAIPEDISLIGFDDRPICRLVDPPLTTISVPLTLFGPSAANLLITKLKHPRNQSLKVDIGTTLLKRSSVFRILQKPADS